MVEAQDRGVVERARGIVEKYHDTPRTLYTGNYNRHPVRVARILLEEFDVKNTRAVLIALCHDLGEWSEYDVKNLKNEFGTDVIAGVETLTWNQGDTWDTFFQKIVSTKDDDLIKVKMADKLDNNRAAAFSSEAEKQKAREKTEKVLRPFVEKNYPEYWEKFEESLIG
ncbi:MAG: hypothetical protein IPJ68_02650 [Candidatus Moraniibacteriota bacterium]|nr:MAG: hypothetical protein IPJ68_02650 [Candidatus Moranbacteria bacterium]